MKALRLESGPEGERGGALKSTSLKQQLITRPLSFVALAPVLLCFFVPSLPRALVGRAALVQAPHRFVYMSLAARGVRCAPKRAFTTSAASARGRAWLPAALLVLIPGFGLGMYLNDKPGVAMVRESSFG